MHKPALGPRLVPLVVRCGVPDHAAADSQPQLAGFVEDEGSDQDREPASNGPCHWGSGLVPAQGSCVPAAGPGLNLRNDRLRADLGRPCDAGAGKQGGHERCDSELFGNLGPHGACHLPNCRVSLDLKQPGHRDTPGHRQTPQVVAKHVGHHQILGADLGARQKLGLQGGVALGVSVAQRRSLHGPSLDQVRFSREEELRRSADQNGPRCFGAPQDGERSLSSLRGNQVEPQTQSRRPPPRRPCRHLPSKSKREVDLVACAVGESLTNDVEAVLVVRKGEFRVQRTDAHRRGIGPGFQVIERRAMRGAKDSPPARAGLFGQGVLKTAG